jgi:hypothetical protein
VKYDKQPLVTGEDARVVMEVLFAAYESAGTGRKVTLPFKTEAAKPFDLWKGKSEPEIRSPKGKPRIDTNTHESSRKSAKKDRA